MIQDVMIQHVNMIQHVMIQHVNMIQHVIIQHVMIQHVNRIQIVLGGERATDLPFVLSGLFLTFKCICSSFDNVFFQLSYLAPLGC